MNRKKILVMVDWFAPGYKAGGPIQSCVNFAFALKNHFDIYVLTTDTDHGETKPYEGIIPNQWTRDLDPAIHVYYAKKANLTVSLLKNVIIETGADYVYLNHLFSPYFVLYPLWLKLTGQLKSEIVLCPRGALYDSALSVKPFKKKPFLKLFTLLGMQKRIIFHATNLREKDAINTFFPGSRIIIADNLPKSNQRAFVSRKKEPGFLRCIFISRIVPIKNLLFFLEAIQKTKNQIHLSVIGPTEDDSYWALCEKKIRELPDNITVTYEGPKKNNELNAYLQDSHLFVLPTTGENFGHSIFEAFLAGRPVLISDQTPWLKLCEKKAGWDLSLTQPEQFADIIDKVAGWDQSQYDEWAMGAWQYASNFIKNPVLTSQYLQLFP